MNAADAAALADKLTARLLAHEVAYPLSSMHASQVALPGGGRIILSSLPGLGWNVHVRDVPGRRPRYGPVQGPDLDPATLAAAVREALS